MNESQDTTKENIEQQRKMAFEIVAKEAAGLYNMMLTVATAFLGGTLLFLEKFIAVSTFVPSIIILALAWLLICAAIIYIIRIRVLNLRSGTYFLTGRVDKAREIDNRNKRLTNIAVVTLGTGIFLLVVFGIVNVASHNGISSSPEKGSSCRCTTD